jgi:Trypsin-co-occurring domain 2
VELEDFIRSSVLQIMRAIKSAQEEWSTPASGAGVISPAWDGPDDFKNRVQEVKFDVAVTAGAKNEGGGGGGIKVVALDLSGKISHSTENSTVSRIAFSIPILPPTTVIQKRDEI